MVDRKPGPKADFLLDVTRMVRRGDSQPATGIDRVLLAYAEHFLDTAHNVLFLTRMMTGYAVLDKKGMQAFLQHVDGSQPWPRLDLVSRLAARQTSANRKSEAAVRKLSPDGASRAGLVPLLSRCMAGGFTYINVGHSNLSPKLLANIRKAGAGRIAVMVHDLIPLDFPEFARPGITEEFATQMQSVVSASDVIFCNSSDTKQRLLHWCGVWGLETNAVTVLLGATWQVDAQAGPSGVAPTIQPQFVTLGTIEPRKNHLLLLNLWRRFHQTLPADKIPHLHIVGRRGWENENILDILERAPFMGKSVFERGTISDADLWPLLRGARALLFPSFVEGFGLPLVEAMQAGLPVICSDLPCFREIGGAYPVYLDPTDGPGWRRAILAQMLADADDRPVPELPTWGDHFETVMRYLERPAPTD